MNKKFIKVKNDYDHQGHMEYINANMYLVKKWLNHDEIFDDNTINFIKDNVERKPHLKNLLNKYEDDDRDLKSKIFHVTQFEKGKESTYTALQKLCVCLVFDWKNKSFDNDNDDDDESSYPHYRFTLNFDKWNRSRFMYVVTVSNDWTIISYDVYAPDITRCLL